MLVFSQQLIYAHTVSSSATTPLWPVILPIWPSQSEGSSWIPRLRKLVLWEGTHTWALLHSHTTSISRRVSHRMVASRSIKPMSSTSFTIHVACSGGTYSIADFQSPLMTARGHNTLVTFNTQDRVEIGPSSDGQQQFSASILAPFSEVVVERGAGYIGKLPRMLHGGQRKNGLVGLLQY